MRRTIKEIFARSVILANKDMRIKIRDLESYLETQYLIEEVQLTCNINSQVLSLNILSL